MKLCIKNIRALQIALAMCLGLGASYSSATDGQCNPTETVRIYASSFNNNSPAGPAGNGRFSCYGLSVSQNGLTSQGARGYYSYNDYGGTYTANFYYTDLVPGQQTRLKGSFHFSHSWENGISYANAHGLDAGGSITAHMYFNNELFKTITTYNRSNYPFFDTTFVPSSNTATIKIVQHNTRPWVCEPLPEVNFTGAFYQTREVDDPDCAPKPPQPANDSESVDNDVAMIDIDVLANDSVPEGVANLTIVSGPAHGSASVFTPAGSSTPQIRYTLADGFFGEDTLVYEVTDTKGQIGTASVEIQINEVIYPLQLKNDTAAVVNDFPAVDIDVLVNDSVPEGVSLLEIISTPAQGDVLVFTPAGSSTPQIRYELSNPFFGEDTFSYQVTDDRGQTGIANVTIVANGVVGEGENSVLQLFDDTVPTNNGVATININVLENDSVSKGVASLEIVSAPAQGGASVFTPVGSQVPQIHYTLASGFVGQDTLVYRVTDNSGQTDMASVTIDISQPVEEQTCRENTLQPKCVLCVLPMPFLQQFLGCP